MRVATPLRRCAAAPLLRRCAAKPLRLSRLARLFDLRAVCRGRLHAARYTSPSRTMRFVGGWSATPPSTAARRAYVTTGGRFEQASHCKATEPFRTTPALLARTLLPHYSRTTPAAFPHYSRSSSALLPHYSRTTTALLPDCHSAAVRLPLARTGPQHGEIREHETLTMTTQTRTRTNTQHK